MDAIKNTAAQNIQPVKTNTAQNNQPAAENKVEMKKDGNKKLAAALMGLAALGTVGVVAYKVTHGKPVNVGIEDLKKAGVGYDDANKMMKNAQGLITDKDGNIIKDLVINAKKGPANIKIKDGQIVESTIAGTKKNPGCVKKFSTDNETGEKIVKIFDESGEKLQKSMTTKNHKVFQESGIVSEKSIHFKDAEGKTVKTIHSRNYENGFKAEIKNAENLDKYTLIEQGKERIDNAEKTVRKTFEVTNEDGKELYEEISKKVLD